jgi:hypothetical protein
MRAKEFTINVPITITINGDEDPVVSAGDQTEPELQQNPVMVSPLQQSLELAKADQGKESPVIDKITADDTIGQEPNEQDADTELLQRLKQLISR